MNRSVNPTLPASSVETFTAAPVPTHPPHWHIVLLVSTSIWHSAACDRALLDPTPALHLPSLFHSILHNEIGVINFSLVLIT